MKPRRMRNAMPWFTDVASPCSDNPLSIDMEVEKVDTGRLPRKYNKELKHFYHTDDKSEIMQHAWKDQQVPVFLKECNGVFLYDKKKNRVLKKLAGRRMRGSNA